MSGTTVPCRRCGGTLRFIRTREGKPMPVNPVPDNTGNVAALRTSRGRYIDGHVIPPHEHDKAREQGYTIFRPHFADCREEPVIKPAPDDQASLF